MDRHQAMLMQCHICYIERTCGHLSHGQDACSGEKLKVRQKCGRALVGCVFQGPLLAVCPFEGKVYNYTTYEILCEN